MPILDSNKDRAAAIIVTLGLGLALAMAPYAIGLLGAPILYVVAAPIHRRLARTLGIGAAAALVLVGALVLLLAPAVWLGAEAVSQAGDLVTTVQTSPTLAHLDRFRIGSFPIGLQLVRASGTISSWISAQAFDAVGTAARGAMHLAIALLGLYYLLLAGPSGWSRFRPLLPFSDKNAEQLRDRFVRVTQATLVGTAAVAFLQALVVGGAFALAGIPSPVFWAVIAAVASLIPVVGASLVWLPALGLLLVSHRYGDALWIIGLCGAIGANIDNVVRPMVNRRFSNIHPMVTLLGAFMGIKVAGLLGLVLGPLAILYLFELTVMYREEYGSALHGRRATDRTTRGTAPLVTEPIP